MRAAQLPRISPLALALGGALLLLVLAVLLAVFQRPIGAGRYEFDVVQPFQGRLRLGPYPALEVERNPYSEGWSAVSVYPLASRRARGFARDLRSFDGQLVTLNARVLCAGELTMLEVEEESITAETRPIEFPEPGSMRDVGDVRLRGEIVDLKSYLGFREPEWGDLVRGPAGNSLRAGVPPVLVVRDAESRTKAFLLVRPDGSPVGDAVVGRLARPVEIAGRLQMWGDFPVLAANPEDYRNLLPWE